MSLWGTTTADGDKPKFLPVDSNAAGSTGAREHLIASASGWALTPGLAASGNDNTDAQPEILVCIKNLAEAMGNASVIGIDWTDAEVGNVGLFDITITFDEAVDITSAGTNQLVFRGRNRTNAAAGYLAFASASILFNGTANLEEEDGKSALGIRQEAGTAASPTFGDSIILDGISGAVATVNGALTESTALVVDTVTGTHAIGQVITVQGAAASISDSDGNTGISTDNTLTITAVDGVNLTLSEAITVANDIILLAMASAGDELISDSIALAVAGPEFDTRVDTTLVARTGETLGGSILLEEGTDGGDAEDAITLNGTDGDSADADSSLDLEDKTSGIATYSQDGTTSGAVYVLNGITVAAA